MRHYRHTNFTFLLRWDPSTRWFEELWPHCWGAWFPDERLEFEPPPGVTFSSNPFPHALYLANRPPPHVHSALAACGYFALNADKENPTAASAGVGCSPVPGLPATSEVPLAERLPA